MSDQLIAKHWNRVFLVKKTRNKWNHCVCVMSLTEVPTHTHAYTHIYAIQLCITTIIRYIYIYRRNKSKCNTFSCYTCMISPCNWVVGSWQLALFILNLGYLIWKEPTWRLAGQWAEKRSHLKLFQHSVLIIYFFFA